MAILSVSQLALAGKRVLLRCDFNVPLDGGRIADPGRIDLSLDTIRCVTRQGGIAILCSHLGRPKGPTPELSLAPVANYLGDRLGTPVELAPDCVGEAARRIAARLKAGGAMMLENLRFHPEEEANDEAFARELAAGKEVYVNDAFAAAHRAHASTAAVAKFFTERAAGLLMMRELEALRAFTENPARPWIVILGGAKVSEKISLLSNLIAKVDMLLVGGAMAYTFLKARGIPVGKSRVEDDRLSMARELMAQAQARKVAFVLPQDHRVAPSAARDAVAQVVREIPDDMMGLDIGPATADDFIARLTSARTVIWNGPLGYFELPAFAAGTLKVGEALAHSGAQTLIGGGDTAAALAHQPWSRGFTHISTGGGATLEYLEGRELPGVKALEIADRPGRG